MSWRYTTVGKTTEKENGDILLRIIIKNSIYNNRYNNILITKEGIYRIYYTDNQKRFYIKELINDF